jgi:hypothetical protein
MGAWLDALFGLQQRFYVDVQRYARAIAAPEPHKVQRYIVDAGFYDAAEPIIAAAHALQRREALARARVHAAIDADADSHYAQALATACRYLEAASRCFEREIDADELRASLGIGKAGRDGRPV